VVLLLTIGLCIFLGQSLLQGKLDIRECLNHPERYDGNYIDYFIELRVEKLLPSGFIGNERGTRVKFITDERSFKVGERVEVSGIFHKDGTVTVSQFHSYPNDLFLFKIIVSLLATLVSTTYFLVVYRNQFVFQTWWSS